MITGFNTDVPHGGRVYHVQTEDRGREHPVVESLVYVGGVIIARKRTPYGQDVEKGTSEEAIALMLRKQHQVIIAAIKAGRVEELTRHSSAEREGFAAIEQARAASQQKPATPLQIDKALLPEVHASPASPAASAMKPVPVEPQAAPPAVVIQPKPSAAKRYPTGSLKPRSGNTAERATGERPYKQSAIPTPSPAQPPESKVQLSKEANSGRLGVNLDQLISDYLKRSSEQSKLDLRVLSPNSFIAGKPVALKVQIARAGAMEPEAIVTVKVIGTAFKPQVFMSRSDFSGIATFNFTLPSFTAGTAAIVIEAQSNRGRGELKHLIRRG